MNFIKIFILTVILVFSPAACYLHANDSGVINYSGEGKFTIPFGRRHDYSGVLVKRAIDGDTLQLETGDKKCICSEGGKICS